ncbi:MAG: hypothetical protein R3F42_16245 [Pseudomonadota bacterium]
MKMFNSIGFIGLVVFCAVVLTSIVFSAPATVAPPLAEHLAEWPWLLQAQTPATAPAALLPAVESVQR